MLQYSLVVLLAAAAVALPTNDIPLFPGALPASRSFRYAPFREIGGRIIEGEKAVKGQFPHQAALFLPVFGGTAFCGGSLIAPTWVLTAGHCAEGILGATAVLGLVDINDNTGVGVTGLRAVVHPQYSSQTLENDIALIELERSVTYTEAVSAITLSSSAIGTGIDVTISGFGKTSDTGSVSDLLYYVHLTTISNTECNMIYGEVGNTVVCATGASLRSTCNGDSGGALITGTGTNAVQVGVVSFGHIDGCALGYPTGYTRVNDYRGFIQTNAGV